MAFVVWCVEEYARGMFDDNIEGEYSGIYHGTREKAETELREAQEDVKKGKLEHAYITEI